MRTSESRERILDASVRCLTEYGYAATSTLKIQEMAGVSRVLYRSIYDTVEALFGPVLSAQPRYSLVREILLSSMRGTSLVHSFRTRDPADGETVRRWSQLASELLVRPRPV